MKIKSIKKIRCNSKRYDIETEKYNCFFANNILVHNCSFYVNYKNGKVVKATSSIQNMEQITEILDDNFKK